MKKILYLLPLLLGIFACRAQSQSPQNIADMVNATLTSDAQNNPQGLTPQTTSVPIAVEAQPTAMQPQPLPSDSLAPTVQSQSLPSSSLVPTGNITYFWPRTLPEGFILSREISHANSNSFALTFINPSVGAISLMGGAEVALTCSNSSVEPVVIRGLEGCFLPSTGGGFTVVWKENGTYYSVGVAGTYKDLALATAEQLESLDLSTFLARLVP